jgi:hypothetical protein
MIRTVQVGRAVDFDVEADVTLFELVAVNSDGRQRRVGHLSRDAGTYVADLFADQPTGTLDLPTRYRSPSRYVALAWARRRLRQHEQGMGTPHSQRRRIAPRPHGAPVDDARDPGPRVYRVATLRGAAVGA